MKQYNVHVSMKIDADSPEDAVLQMAATLDDAAYRMYYRVCDHNDVSIGLYDAETLGQCDCGATYDVGSRLDHDADTGECWDCSDRSPDTMTTDELDAYLRGETL